MITLVKKITLALVLLSGIALAQTATLTPAPNFQALDCSTGTCLPLTGGLLYSYISGTGTALATCATNSITGTTCTTANANPVVFNSSGYNTAGSGNAGVWLLQRCYTLTLKNSGGTTLWSQDNVCAGTNSLTASTGNDLTLTGGGTFPAQVVIGQSSNSHILLTPGSGSSVVASGPISDTDTTQSTTALTGSVKVAGGIGVVKNAWVGGLVNLSTNAGTDCTATGIIFGSASECIYRLSSGVIGISSAVTMNGPLTSIGTTQSTSAVTGDIKTAGGAGIAKNVWVGGLINLSTNSGSTCGTTGIILGVAGECIYLYGSGSIGITASSVHLGGDFLPSVTATSDLGTSTFAWRHVVAGDYAVGASVGITAATCSSFVGGICVAP